MHVIRTPTHASASPPPSSPRPIIPLTASLFSSLLLSGSNLRRFSYARATSTSRKSFRMTIQLEPV
ncbi:hypothetical protein PUN28_016420 [Cardiocondyla obscurior]|uniref:Uncharacterized protein n=1 Tax=Cardiocondyla obscurior TaxID=286306 RepID=A0AAW2EM15_9HYME